LQDVCPDRNSHYDTLPVVDSARWSDERVSAGIRPVAFDKEGRELPIAVRTIDTDESTDGELALRIHLEDERTLHIRCSEQGVGFAADWPDWGLRLLWGDTPELPEVKLEQAGIAYAFNGYPYRIGTEGARPPILLTGGARGAGNGIELRAAGSELKLRLSR
jgi:hypothetical protein